MIKANTIKFIEPSNEFKQNLLASLNERIEQSSRNNFNKQLISVDGFKQVEVITAGSGKPLLLLHGLGSIPEAYKKTINYLQNYYFVIAPTLPGHGNTLMEGWFKDQSFETVLNNYSIFLERVLAKLTVKEPVVLIGHNFGGTVGIKYAAKFPKRVSKLILIDTATSPVYLDQFSTLMKIISMNWEYVKHAKKLPYKVLTYFIKNFKSMLYYNVMMSKINIQKDLSRINTNTFIYWGENDSLFPIKLGMDMTRKIRKSEFNLVKNRNHNWLLDSPEKLQLSTWG